MHSQNAILILYLPLIQITTDENNVGFLQNISYSIGSIDLTFSTHSVVNDFSGSITCVGCIYVF